MHPNDSDRARLAGTHANVGRKRGKPEAESPHSIHLAKLLRNLRVGFRRNDKDILRVGLPFKSSQVSPFSDSGTVSLASRSPKNLESEAHSNRRVTWQGLDEVMLLTKNPNMHWTKTRKQYLKRHRCLTRL